MKPSITRDDSTHLNASELHMQSSRARTVAYGSRLVAPRFMSTLYEEVYANTGAYFHERSECTANTVCAFRETLVFPPGDILSSATHLSTSVAIRIQKRAVSGWLQKVKGRETRGVRNCRGWKPRRISSMEDTEAFLRAFHRNKETRRGGNRFHTLVDPCLSFL